MPTSGQTFPYQSFLTPDPTTFFRDNIGKFIPGMYQTGEFEGTSEFFEVLVAPMLDELYQRGIDLPQLANIDRCPPMFLQLLAGNINTLTVEDTFDETQPVSFRRRELGKMVDIFKLRGNRNSFERILKYLGALNYGVIVPREFLNILDITPLPGPIPGDTNDVGEDLKPQSYDISSSCNGVMNGQGELVGTKIQYVVPKAVIRSTVSVFWNGNDMPYGPLILYSDGATDPSFQFDKLTGVLITNFIPMVGDSLIVRVNGDPRYLQTFKLADAAYYRPGTTDVYSDVDPELRFAALNDRRPAGTLLYLTWLLSFFSVKYFAPPDADYNRNGYPGVLPPDELSTYDANNPGAADPWFVSGTVTLSVVGETALGHLTVSTSVTVSLTGVGGSGQAGAAGGVDGHSISGVSGAGHAGTVTVVGTAILHMSGVSAHEFLGSVGSGVPLIVTISGVSGAGHVGTVGVVTTP